MRRLSREQAYLPFFPMIADKPLACCRVDWKRSLPGIYALPGDVEMNDMMAVEICNTPGNIQRNLSSPAGRTSTQTYAADFQLAGQPFIK